MARGVKEILAGRYELLGVLGRGGMGVVYRARDHVLDRTVAVKILPGDRAEDPTFVARFEREARAAAALNHPNIVGVFDTGRDGETRFIVMEYVPGPSLAVLVRQHAPLAPERAVEIAMQIGSALAAAHRAGIVHRDVKPGNVMVPDSCAVKVLDFGIARAVASTSLTQTAVVLGSAPYLAPEVSRGERADERSDIYSLGCVLYEMLTARPPFTGELPAAIMHQHNTAQPLPPRELNPNTPPALGALVLRSLAKRPSDRPQTATELIGALGDSLDGRLFARAPRGLTGVRALALTQTTRVLARPRRWGRARLALAAALAIVLIGLAVALLGSSGAKPARTAKRRVATTPHASHTTASHPAPTTTVSTTTSTQPKPTQSTPPTVPAAGGVLTTLITQDLQSGAIDQHGQDILNHLQDVLNAYQQGHAGDALHKMDDLANHVADLSDHGDIQPSALPAINSAISSLRTAILRSAPSAGKAGP